MSANIIEDTSLLKMFQKGFRFVRFEFPGDEFFS